MTARGISSVVRMPTRASMVAAKVSALIKNTQPEPTPALFADGAVEVRTGDAGEWLGGASTVEDAVKALLAQLGPKGYLSVQAYLDRLAFPQLAEVRDDLAAATGRPTTFGWGPRFLHSTGQYHKGGPAVGVFLQITADSDQDVEIPERPFTFAKLISAQAAGDAQVLADHGRPVLRLNLSDRAAGVAQLTGLVSELAR